MAENVLDLKSLEPDAAEHLFKGRETQKRLMDSFLAERSPEALWYAQVLNSLAVPDLDEAILAVIGHHDNHTRMRLLNLLSNRAGGKAVTVLAKYTRGDDRTLAAAALQTVRRLGTPSGAALCQSILETTSRPDIKALAAAGCLGSASAKYRKQVDAWLASGDPELRLAGVIGAGESGQADYLPVLGNILSPGEEPLLLTNALKSYGQLSDGLENTLATPYLQHPDRAVRLAAIDALRIDGDRALQQAITLLGDPDNRTRRTAEESILAAPYQNGPLLIEALNRPGKKRRDGLFRILSALDIKAVDTFSYAKNQIETCYRRLAEAEALRQMQTDRYAALLADHLEHQGRGHLEDLIRVVTLQDRSGAMRTIFRSLFSNDPRQQANAREALEDVADRTLLQLFMPLVEDRPRHSVLTLGRKRFKFPDYAKDLAALYADLVQSGNWVTVVIALPAAANCQPVTLPPETLTSLAATDNPHIHQAVARYMRPDSSGRSSKETDMEMEMPIPDKILHLRQTDIFKNMSVDALAAIASIAEKVKYPAGRIIFREGDAAESMYMVIAGEITAYSDGAEPPERFKPGDSIGGIALLTDDARLFSARASAETSLLMIHKRDFLEIVREYPQIALDISKLLCEYVKELWQRASDRSYIDGNSIFDGPAGIDRSDQ